MPSLARFYGTETDLRVLREYDGLFQRISQFSMFSFTEEPQEINGYQLQCTGEHPFLSMPFEWGFDTEAYLERRRLFVTWWNMRDQFPDIPARVAAIRNITGTSPAEYAKYDYEKFRAMEKQFVYGIYNIPVYIDLVE